MEELEILLPGGLEEPRGMINGNIQKFITRTRKAFTR